MRRKRLQHVANGLCQMFCGWRLIASKPILVDLGSGVLEIDVLTERCTFPGKPTATLPIAQELSAWVQTELLAHHIPATGIIRAGLTAKLSFIQVPWNQQTQEIFYSHGQIVRTKRMHRCIFECEGEVTTDEMVYRSKLRDVQEWPLGWPGA